MWGRKGWLGGLAVSGLVGCTGEVDVYLVDRSIPEPGGEVGIATFALPLEEVEAEMEGEWVPLARGPDPYNLLDFSSEPTTVELVGIREEPARIAHDELSLGSITALRLQLSPGKLISMTTDEGVMHFLSVPADAEGRWMVDVEMDIEKDTVTERTLDLRVREGLTIQDDGSWAFVPVLEPVGP